MNKILFLLFNFLISSNLFFKLLFYVFIFTFYIIYHNDHNIDPFGIFLSCSILFVFFVWIFKILIFIVLSQIKHKDTYMEQFFERIKNERKYKCKVVLYALLSGKLPFDDTSVRNLLTKVKSGQYYMPDFDKPLQDLVSRMLTVDPSQRITIAQIKQHPAFKMYSPDNYVFPKPIPLPFLPDPIDLSTVDPNVYKILTQLGYSSEDEVKSELSAPTHNMAKVFYSMLMNQVSLRSLPWDMLHDESQGHILSQDQFLVSPQTSFGAVGMVQTGDPFRRLPKVPMISSPEIYSYAEKTDGWGTSDFSTLETDTSDEEQDFTLEMKMEQFMVIAQKIMTNFGYVYFHPDDVQLICKKYEPETYIMFNGLCTTDTQIEINMSRKYGTSLEFSDIVAALTEELHSIMDDDE